MVRKKNVGTPICKKLWATLCFCGLWPGCNEGEGPSGVVAKGAPRIFANREHEAQQGDNRAESHAHPARTL
jgi:hypothetical protein